MNTRAGPTPSDRPFPSLPSTKTNDAVITTTNVAQQVWLHSVRFHEREELNWVNAGPSLSAWTEPESTDVING